MLYLDFDERVILERVSRVIDGEQPLYIYDVGAAHGHWSMLLEELLFDVETRFNLFEANLENINNLVTVCDKPTWDLVPCPVSNKSGLVVFEMNDYNSEHSMIVREKPHVDGRRVIMSSITLDEYADLTRSHPSFIKIDVEGAEVDVLLGSREYALLLRPYIQFEYGGQWRFHHRSLNGMYKLLDELDYAIFSVNEDKTFRRIDSSEPNDYVMRNMIAVPAEKVQGFLNG